VNQEVVKLWVDALRSGEYQQTTELLHDNKGLCCLGVASSLYCKLVRDISEPYTYVKKVGKVENGEYSTEEETVHCIKYGDNHDILPKEVKDWIGLQRPDGTFETDDGVPDSLADLNDSGKTFAEIADIIESRPTGLFV